MAVVVRANDLLIFADTCWVRFLYHGFIVAQADAVQVS
jgi:hypothetical protein